MTPAIRRRILTTALIVLASVAPPAAAFDYYVTTMTDTNDGFAPYSLRDAIMLANANPGPDTIYLPPATIELSIAGINEDAALTGDLDITGALSIIGSGPGLSIIDGNSVDRVFDIFTNDIVLFRGLTITGGYLLTASGGGAGIRNYQGNYVFIQSCEVTGNIASGTFGRSYFGGGILNLNGDMWITDSMISDNLASYAGGGIASVGSGANLYLSRTTVYSNSTNFDGGALFTEGESSILNSTISSNTGPIGASGVWNIGNAHFGSSTIAENVGSEILSSEQGSLVTLANTIIWGTCSGPQENLATSDGNLEYPGDTCDLGALDIVSAPSLGLSPIGYYGGPTMTYRPLAGSLVVDHEFAQGNCTTKDQRNVVRPVDGNGDNVDECDIGAVEWLPGEVFVDGFEDGYLLGWSEVSS